MDSARRGFMKGSLAAAAIASNSAVEAQQPAAAAGQGNVGRELPAYARTMNHRSLRQSSYDRTGGNSDRWPIAPGATQEVFNS